MRRAAYVLAYAAGLLTWAAAMLALGATVRLAVWAQRAWPDAPGGNCWAHALPLWEARGGYLIVRPAHGIRVLRRWRVPHCMWAPGIGDLPVEMYAPIRRRRAMWAPWFKFWFRGTVLHRDRA